MFGVYFNCNGGIVDDAELERLYDDMLDDCYPVVTCGSLEIGTISYVLRKCDPVAYSCGLSDYIDSCVTDGLLFETDPTLETEE